MSVFLCRTITLMNLTIPVMRRLGNFKNNMIIPNERRPVNSQN